MSILSQEEITLRIANIDKQIEIATQADSYSLSSGMSSQSVKRQSITSLLQLRDYWTKKLEESIVSEVSSFHCIPMQTWSR